MLASVDDEGSSALPTGVSHGLPEVPRAGAHHGSLVAGGGCPSDEVVGPPAFEAPDRIDGLHLQRERAAELLRQRFALVVGGVHEHRVNRAGSVRDGRKGQAMGWSCRLDERRVVRDRSDGLGLAGTGGHEHAVEMVDLVLQQLAHVRRKTPPLPGSPLPVEVADRDRSVASHSDDAIGNAHAVVP